MEAIVWLIVLAVMVVIEIITLGLTTIWFAAGALVAMILALLGLNTVVQIIAWAVVSVILLLLTRPLALKYMSKTTKTNVDSLIGMTAKVTEEIDNINAKGYVTVNGQDWAARNIRDDEVIMKDTYVTIDKISGVKLIVEVKLD